MSYTIVETSKLAAVRGGGHIWSLIAEADVENGHVGFVGDLDADTPGLETHEFVVPTTALINTQRPVLIANPEWDYNENSKVNQAMYNYINKANIPFRAYDLARGDVYAVTAEGINVGNDTVTVGKYVILEDGETTVKMVEESATSGLGFVGKIIGSAQRGLGWTAKDGTTVVGRPYTVYFIEILRNDIVDGE